MAQVDTLDIIVLLLLLVGSVAYFTKGTYWGVPKDPYASSNLNGSASKKGSRNIVEKLEETGKNCVIFYGSQTGTAEDYASRLAKEGHARFGLSTMTADLEDYDFENLDTFPEDKIAFFVMATYGEGEPTDNAVEFWEFINADPPSFSEASEDKPLGKLKYVAFGLGNNTYEHYNLMVRNLDKILTNLGAERIGTAGEGDDGAGTMEEDFLAWKEPMWAALAEKMGLEEREAVYEPVFSVEEKEDMSVEDDTVYLGEPNKNHLENSQKGPYNAHNPFIAPIAESREVFTVKDRNCLHVEVDISGSGMTYTTGDHIAVWPTNAGMEVDRFLKTFGLDSKRHTVISLKGLDPTAKVPFPTPTTYDAAVRYHIEICAPVSRQFMATLAAFAPNEEAKKEAARLGSDADYFKDKISSQMLNIAQAISAVSSEPWSAVPFSCLVEGLNKLQPRYYSISSSSVVQPQKISVTAVVESLRIPGAGHIVKGVTTNYLLALKQKQNGDPDPSPHGLTYSITGPRNKYDGIHVPVHVRHSNFKLPSNPNKPIIMVGPGTGVAPFRGFVQERAELAKRGEDVGQTVLFFGCRKSTEDWLYKEEWEAYKQALGDKLTIFNAFSREQAHKIYVQHLIKQNGKLVNELLQQKANFYVCGDAAHMAREVNEVLGQIIAQERGIDEKKAEQVVKSMRSSGVYQEDVWS
ncbi:NADPH-cytochrome P450 reductase [Exophiala aquamarina CBS 119918]|uniref:NADPH--cytochrome P450 reductase n=1 Tax=Exophiala aquamarina CBS 119918 TaxID=1182545 RepID=A0A072NYE7_9EURO|nr:NADPH-cytochrome P450 reductase [Exophiala aquamarina CBS 119918]KEF52884.1 NADPH-cytochrome P450 reductase [Exophiala aquamarina CBS 119918]